MRTLIVYYSLSGTTAELAKALADLLGADLAEIRCDRYRRGLIGYVRAAYDSVRGILPSVALPPAVDRPCDLMIVAGPMWAGHAATPVRAFLAAGRTLPRKIALVLTRGGSSPILLIKSLNLVLRGNVVEIRSPQTSSLNLSSTKFRSKELLSKAACATDSEKPLSTISARCRVCRNAGGASGSGQGQTGAACTGHTGRFDR